MPSEAWHTILGLIAILAAPVAALIWGFKRAMNALLRRQQLEEDDER